MSSLNNANKKSPREEKFTVLRQNSYAKLFKKYSSGDYSFGMISINNLVFNDTCLVVARFKDFLIYDDNTDFLRRFYNSKESNQRLNKILNFYEKYSKIFPNYLVLKENKYLYRNIRKKQKMIDAINEIKREEKENKKRLKEKGKGYIDGKKTLENNNIFTKKIKDEIKAFQKNISFKYYKNSFDTDKDIDDTLMINQNSISISILNWKQYENNVQKNELKNINWGESIDSFITNPTNGSISAIFNVLNDNKIYTKELTNIFTKYNNNQNQKTLNNKSKNENGKKKITKKANTNTKTLNTRFIKNNIQNKDKDNESKKNIINNNKLKYAKTSTNATSSSSILSKRIKNQITSSSAFKNNKSNKENINEEHIENNNKNIIFTVNNIHTNTNTNIYNKTSPKVEQLQFKKHFFKTNTNFNIIKKSLSKQKEKEKFSTIKKDKIVTSNPNENIIKKYIKCRHISQDFDKNTVTKVTDNILNNNKKGNKYLTENSNININSNPNLITGDTKININNNIKEKVHVNVRDIIKKNKEKEKQKEKQ